MLADPALGGGLRPTVDVLRSYFGSEKRSDKLLHLMNTALRPISA